ARAPLPDLLQHAPVLALHALDHLLARRAACEAVALGQKRALARDVFDIAGEDIAFQEMLHDLLGGPPFGQRDGVLDDLAPHHGVDYVADAGVAAEHIFAGLEIGVRAAPDESPDEDHRMLVEDALP